MDSQKSAPHCIMHRICGKNISGLKCLLDRSVKGIISAKSICVYRSTHCTYIIRRIYCCILVKDHNQTLQQYYGTCKDNHHRVIFPYFRNASKNSTACFRLSGTYSPLFFYCADHSCADNQSHDSCPYISRSCQGYPFQCHRYDHQFKHCKVNQISQYESQGTIPFYFQYPDQNNACCIKNYKFQGKTCTGKA